VTADLLYILLGFALLVFGGEALVRGATGVAFLARISPSVVGLTIVAAGTSMPEMVVSVQAALQGSPGLATGNVVGSNIFNIAAILGLTALIQPLRIQGTTVRFEWPVMMLAAMQLHLLSRDHMVDRLEGSFLLSGMVIFVAYAVYLGRQDPDLVPTSDDLATASFGRTGRSAFLLNSAAILLGIAVLAGGSTALVHGAVGIAASFGVSETVIGLTIVAAGTSFPELMTSLVAARRGQDGIAVGNIVGSNIFNVLAILGVTSLVSPLDVPPEIVSRDNWWMIGISLLLFPLMKSGMRISRGEGALLLTGYIVYASLLVHGATSG
jgi:cation:H+ antiporter